MASKDVGISVLITSFGIIFTTIWLYILLPQRENRKWKCVEKEVKKELAGTLRNLFEVTKGYFKGSVVGISYASNENVNEDDLWENARLEKLKEFANKEELKISGVGKIILKKGNSATFAKYKKDLSEIELKYFKFMKPEEVLSLIRIQKLLFYLTSIIESTQIKIFNYPEEHYEKNLGKYSLELFKEIYKFHKNFIRLFPKNEK